jgi:hypothetical protein
VQAVRYSRWPPEESIYETLTVTLTPSGGEDILSNVRVLTNDVELDLMRDRALVVNRQPEAATTTPSPAVFQQAHFPCKYTALNKSEVREEYSEIEDPLANPNRYQQSR